ncbi:MAG: D-methionine transport system substrate-binding protein [Thermoanaerobacteraceae bacterium]|jgi:D-methionine transport system substrate-binding protein|uniref:Lipoprotein n=1 Tax=Biomaibacter acetigenes TaxID=2316383 RepID=A0A3G2R707_9FIRM|nr:MetQ/NlpA family ABC transporter substrate-binding protein [Biomaibacter acetigenes]MDK2878172.1 D-methionine transport system substrate-binding protein [Thermoanaerobacteraceae bacterium]RKL64097.1 MetQ/NlpA family ABC transporter substrate-binding protein [Thermoanaerobacteraceae bacterium SP2]AYO31173.1 MetQ/NlpA family ABC transporter substrate-binding protein [Biomaibacter acetigenes]MDN5301726.1 D-methionine transport system substrate-binding protein [Thermoanaerobacteraceae bacterium]
MKKTLVLILVLGLFLAVIAGCGAKQNSASTPGEQSQDKSSQEAKPVTIKVGASPVPHAEILNVVKPILEKEGIKLDIVEFTDYNQPNLQLADKQLDANYFQHIPYLEKFSKDHNLDLTYIAKVHIEPMGVYSKKVKNLNDLKEGASVAIPNDPTNGGRALLLLQKAGVLKLKDGVGINATVNDIAENPKKLKIQELEAATLPRVLQDVDAAVINTNYALEAKLVPTKDALAIESADSPYVNILAVRKGDENRPELKKLAEALNTPEVKKFIEDKYQGAVVPAF